MTMPGAAASTASTVGRGSARPVGLLGEHKKVMCGAVSANRRPAWSGSMKNCSSRVPRTTSVPVKRLMWLCSA